jgi:hypothetical protein
MLWPHTCMNICVLVPAELVDADIPVEKVAILADPVQEENHPQCAPRTVLSAGRTLNNRRLFLLVCTEFS